MFGLWLDKEIIINLGYGNYDESLTTELPIKDFEDMEIYEGMEFEADTEDGPGIFTIKEIEDERVIIDGNHPFAGVTLVFTGKILKIK